MNQPEKPFIYNYNQVQAPGTDRPEVTLIIERTCVHRKQYSPTQPFRGAWWSQTDSNRRHPACKAGALPTELWPLSQLTQTKQSKGLSKNRFEKILFLIDPQISIFGEAGKLICEFNLVGPTRFELVTSRLSSVRSNQLSYGPKGRKRMVSQTLAYDA